jgi:glycosyltransferase involved in cell wall biosynthesis
MSFRRRKIAVVVPAYKAALTVASVIVSVPRIVEWIIVVDDASPDNLADVVKTIRDPRVIYLRHDKNQGVGGAMVTGFRKALELGADFVAKIDADGQMDPNYLGCFVATALKHDCDYVKGNRFGHIEELKAMPLNRRFGNVCLSFLTKFASGYWNVFDPQNGYVMISKAMLKRLDLGRIDKSYFFENSMLINLNILRAKVAEIYFPSRYGNEISSMKLGRIIKSFPLKLLKGFLYRVYQKYIFRSLSPFFLLFSTGFAALIFGLVWGLHAWWQHASQDIPTPTGTVMIAILPIIIGIMFILQSLVLDIQEAGPSIIVDYDDEEVSCVDDDAPTSCK